MINICSTCKALREYPSGKTIDTCPRCGGTKMIYRPSPRTQPERDALIIACIKGTVPECLD